ncbi:alpha/beta hydrolase [Paenibacillus sp. CGMCC 1.16610]|uniref:Alpha/beta fold hydrolase n=1 Tax=Paenibacillus anseongense TaxID=2682845 RepID=A0ABW9UCA0_9BACL|nr:alpha/beta hydrolase [Paenibacillus sp. CGMCC 1.16610]MBA2937300.1 alpha/beta hydrolase [Paenibacillus sp. CGMCC 1.16610]MVQ36358.1 alpha/beta fold hydrolase [Paenibacillus anseongense]
MGYYVTVEPDVNLYVEDINPEGSKTIVFLHGWPFSHDQFEYQFDVLPSLGFRCIGIDWRGFGKSDRPYSGYTLERLADDIRIVVDTLQLQNFVLAGHSTGGAIAIKYVVRYNGGGVSKLVLIDAAAPRGFTKETAAQLLKQTLNDRANMMQGITDIFFFQYITKPLSDWFNKMGMQAAGWSTAAIIIMLRDFDLNADLPSIQVPTLIVHGIHDKVIPFSQAEEMHRKIPYSRLVPFMYSGHGSFYEERDKLNELLREFTVMN